MVDKEDQNTMKKTVVIVLALLLVFSAGLAFAGGTKEAGAGKEMAEESKTGGTGGVQYPLFEKYKAAAKKGEPYPGAPLKGKVIGFANIYGTIPFCIDVENSIKKHIELAGGSLTTGWISMDNQYDSVIGLKNADIMLSKKPDFFIEFQSDSKVNNIVAAKFGAAGIPMLAIDVPVPGAPFMGANNWGAALMGGRYMAKLIKERWGGWNGVDMVVLGQMPVGGEVLMLRSEGYAQALSEEFGIAVDDPKIVRFDGGMGQAEQAKAGMDDVLAAHPKAKKIAVTSINEQTMSGIIAAIQGAGRWNTDDIIVVTLGIDDLGKSQIREGLSDGGVAFFPERYGEYVVSAAAAILQGEAVPPWIYVENEIINADNIDKWYPKK
jgi:ribose transport system substrate-binding protein